MSATLPSAAPRITTAHQRRYPLSFNLPFLDNLTAIENGLIVLRSRNNELLFSLTVDALVHSRLHGKKILYLHFLDYHTRFWSVKIDSLIDAAKSAAEDPQELLQRIVCMRAFMKDQLECQENWDCIFRIRDVGLVVVDSINELYEAADAPFDREDSHRLFVLGRINALCATHHCIGLILDSSPKDIHPFLGELASIMLEIEAAESQLTIHVRKHPYIGESSFILRQEPP